MKREELKKAVQLILDNNIIPVYFTNDFIGVFVFDLGGSEKNQVVFHTFDNSLHQYTGFDGDLIINSPLSKEEKLKYEDWYKFKNKEDRILLKPLISFIKKLNRKKLISCISIDEEYLIDEYIEAEMNEDGINDECEKINIEKLKKFKNLAPHSLFRFTKKTSIRIQELIDIHIRKQESDES